MKSVIAVLGVATVGVFATVSDPALEMWAPLILSVAPILAFMLWPVRDPAVEPALKKAA